MYSTLLNLKHNKYKNNNNNNNIKLENIETKYIGKHFG
jgi:hypothetical protein